MQADRRGFLKTAGAAALMLILAPILANLVLFYSRGAALASR